VSEWPEEATPRPQPLFLAGSWTLEDVTVMCVGGKCVCISGSTEVALTRCVLGGYRHTGDQDLLSQMHTCSHTLAKKQQEADEAHHVPHMSHTSNHVMEAARVSRVSTEPWEAPNTRETSGAGTRETSGADCKSWDAHGESQTDMLQLVEGRARYALQVKLCTCRHCPHKFMAHRTGSFPAGLPPLLVCLCNTSCLVHLVWYAPQQCIV
jgi:hypothetical protein